MSKKRVNNRNKKRDHDKIAKRLTLLRASQCALYRWGHSPTNALIPHGPPHLSKDRIAACVGWVMESYHHWLVDVYACFLTPESDYYEEMVSIDTADAFGHQIRLKSDGVIWSLEKEAREHARSEGNENHFLDTVTICRLKTEKNLSLLENDKWLKGQAEHRARIIMEELSK